MTECKMTDTFSWLIELHAGCYLYALNDKYLRACFAWTSKDDKALKFATEQQCADAIEAIRELKPDLFPKGLPTSARPVEHCWTVPAAALRATAVERADVEPGVVELLKRLDAGRFNFETLQGAFDAKVARCVALERENAELKAKVKAEDRASSQLLDERDMAQVKLDRFVDALGGQLAHGEHSNVSCPEENAIAHAEGLDAKLVELEAEVARLKTCTAYETYVAEKARADMLMQSVENSHCREQALDREGFKVTRERDALRSELSALRSAPKTEMEPSPRCLYGTGWTSGGKSGGERCGLGANHTGAHKFIPYGDQPEHLRSHPIPPPCPTERDTFSPGIAPSASPGKVERPKLLSVHWGAKLGEFRARAEEERLYAIDQERQRIHLEARVAEAESELKRVRNAYKRLENECIALRDDVTGTRRADPVTLTRLELAQGEDLNRFRIRDTDHVAEIAALKSQLSASAKALEDAKADKNVLINGHGVSHWHGLAYKYATERDEALAAHSQAAKQLANAESDRDTLRADLADELRLRRESREKLEAVELRARAAEEERNQFALQLATRDGEHKKTVDRLERELGEAKLLEQAEHIAHKDALLEKYTMQVDRDRLTGIVKGLESAWGKDWLDHFTARQPQSLIDAGWVPREVAVDALNSHPKKCPGCRGTIDGAVNRWLASRSSARGANADPA